MPEQQYSDLPPGATVVSTPQQPPPPQGSGGASSQYSDLPAGSSVVPEEQVQASALSRFAKNFWEKANPVENIKGIAELVQHPVKNYLTDAKIREKVFEQAQKDYKDGDYVGATSRALFALAPFIGPQLNANWEQFKSGDIAGGLGSMGGMVAGAEALGGVARGVGKVAGPVAEAAYGAGAKVGIAEGLTKTAKGLKEVANRIKQQHAETTATIAARPGRTIPAGEIAAGTARSEATFGTQMVPKQDLAHVRGVTSEFADRYTTPGQAAVPAQTINTGLLDAQGNPITRTTPGTPAVPARVANIPPTEVQAMKTGTNQLIGEKYGKEATPRIEAQKDLVHAAKEALEKRFPEVKAMNAREGRLIDWEKEIGSVVEKANKEASILGVKGSKGNIAVLGAGGLASIFFHPAGPIAAGAVLLKSVLERPGVQSKIALGIYKTGKAATLAKAKLRVAGYVQELGTLIQNEQDQALQNQLQSAPTPLAQ